MAASAFQRANVGHVRITVVSPTPIEPYRDGGLSHLFSTGICWSGLKPEQLEIDRLRSEVAKLKAERDILKNDREPALACGDRNRVT